MRVVQIDELEFKSRANQGRGGKGHSGATVFDSTSLGRDPDRADNFYFGLSISEEGQFSTPRHKHIFSQFRYMVEGYGDYPEGEMTDGVLAYFPQGAYYGPQDTLYGTIFVMQFGDSSGHGYIDRPKMIAASKEMRQRNTGAFDGTGKYQRPVDLSAGEDQDAHEAISEYVLGHKLEYPAPQYTSSILMDSNAVPWTPLPGAAGVEEKALGTFTNCQYKAARYKLDPGATFVANGRGVYVVLSGGGAIEGEKYRKFTAMYLEVGEQGSFAATETSDILYLGLPDMALMQKRVEEPAREAVAA